MDWKETLPINAVRGMILLLSGSGAFELFSGKRFGPIILRGFSSAVSVRFQRQELLENELQGWAAEMLDQCLKGLVGASRVSFFGLVLAAGLFLALIAHVVARSQLGELADGVSIRHRFLKLYTRLYHCLTLAVFLALICLLLLAARSGPWMLVLAVLLEVPLALYLVFYSKDVLAGSFAERFSYVVLAMLLIITIFSVPYKYGRECFDKEFPIAETATRGGEMRRGPQELELVFDQKNSIVGSFRYSKEGDLTIELWQADELEMASTYLSLRELAESREPPMAPREDATSILLESLDQ